MATDLHNGVLSQILLIKEQLKMTKTSNACESLKIAAKALKLFAIICRFRYFSRK